MVSPSRTAAGSEVIGVTIRVIRAWGTQRTAALIRFSPRLRHADLGSRCTGAALTKLLGREGRGAVPQVVQLDPWNFGEAAQPVEPVGEVVRFSGRRTAAASDGG
ncbi:hypothetical protein [Dactylosporangium sp. NPDC049140]|uniref:hypothetical protein n=1 Tax=Dactylosporangium sp. NPDC049140 TaxID=3155647 RepID=UPI0033E144F0